jgi:Polyketide cyclase / dehydrase and lipid transport
VTANDPGVILEDDPGSSWQAVGDRHPGRRRAALRLGAFAAMKTWTATAVAMANPAAVLDVLTDPGACARWAPVPFDVEDDTRRLATGSRARVTGRLAGQRVGFDVEVQQADEGGLVLTADGPVSMDVDYRLAATDGGAEVRASVSLRPRRGLVGRLLAEATGALLTAGALDNALQRLAREAATAT